jgi:lysophospholipase L1-like esterase
MKLNKMGVVYFILLQILIVLMLWKSDFLYKVIRNMGLGEPVIAREMGDEYHRKITAHMSWQKYIPEHAIFIIGDSITEYIKADALPSEFVNLGIGNDTVIGITERLKFYKKLRTAKAIIFAIGVNDLLYRTPKEAAKKFQKLFLQTPHDVQIFVSLVLPVNEKALKFSYIQKRNNKNIGVFNQKIRNLCQIIKRCNIIDAADKMKDPGGQLRPEYHTGDGLHLSEKGYGVWLKIIKGKFEND